MAEGVAIEADVFPVAVFLGAGLEPGFEAEAGEQTIRVEGEQVVLVEVLGVLERAVEQGDVFEVKVGDGGRDGRGIESGVKERGAALTIGCGTGGVGRGESPVGRRGSDKAVGRERQQHGVALQHMLPLED